MYNYTISDLLHDVLHLIIFNIITKGVNLWAVSVNKYIFVKIDLKYQIAELWLNVAVNYSRTSMPRTPLEPWKYVRDKGSSS